MKLKRKYKTLVISILVLFFTFGFTLNSRYFEIARNLDIFATLYKEVNKYYVDDANPSLLINEGIDAMLKSLDPYTVYISEDRIENFRTVNTGQYGGIGAATIRLDNQVFVSMVYEGFAANVAGLEIGDQILSIDNVNVSEITEEKFKQIIKGQANSNVTLGVKRLGSDNILSYTLKREKITIPNVPYSGMITDKIGYIKFTEFTPQGTKNIKRALQELKNKGADKLVLDLRGNPGGLLMEAVSICNLFVPRGKEIVRTKGKVAENNNVFNTKSEVFDAEIPLVILTSSNSASASEIVAGAIQDYDRGVIIGQKSFGKGLVQSTRPLSYNAQLKLTIAKYYIPSGRCIQALDYSNRNKDGSVGRVPDSLITKFSTQSGRAVFDGGGIDPDILIKAIDQPTIITKLFQKGLVFKYASLYKFNNSSFGNPSEFDLNDDEFNKFVAWVSQQSFTYTHTTEEALSKLESTLAEIDIDKYETNTNRLKSLISNLKKKEFYKHKAIIKDALEQEIASRYKLQRGAIEAGLGNDKEIAKSIEILNNTSAYQQLLIP